jgi:hypothetical protein
VPPYKPTREDQELVLKANRTGIVQVKVTSPPTGDYQRAIKLVEEGYLQTTIHCHWYYTNTHSAFALTKFGENLQTMFFEDPPPPEPEPRPPDQEYPIGYTSYQARPTGKAKTKYLWGKDWKI